MRTQAGARPPGEWRRLVTEEQSRVADKRPTLFKGKGRPVKVRADSTSSPRCPLMSLERDVWWPRNPLLSRSNHDEEAAAAAAAGAFYSNLNTRAVTQASLAALFISLREDVNKTNE